MQHNNVLREMNIRSCFGTVCAAAAPAATDSEQCTSSPRPRVQWQNAKQYGDWSSSTVRYGGQAREVRGYDYSKADCCDCLVMQPGIADAMQRCPRLFTGKPVSSLSAHDWNTTITRAGCPSSMSSTETALTIQRYVYNTRTQWR